MCPTRSVAALALGGIVLAGCNSTSDGNQMEAPAEPDHMQPAERTAAPETSDHMQAPERTGPPAISVRIPPPPDTSESDEPTKDAPAPPE
jgi:hypothetical protein